MSDEKTTAEPSGASRGSRPAAFITVPLGDGLVGIAFTRDETGAAGILMRPLKEGHAIGTMATDAEDCGIFIRCPKRESAEVLMRNVRKLVESFGE